MCDVGIGTIWQERHPLSCQFSPLCPVHPYSTLKARSKKAYTFVYSVTHVNKYLLFLRYEIVWHDCKVQDAIIFHLPSPIKQKINYTPQDTYVFCLSWHWLVARCLKFLEQLQIVMHLVYLQLAAWCLSMICPQRRTFCTHWVVVCNTKKWEDLISRNVVSFIWWVHTLRKK